ncbi:MAG: metal ABC transporter permease [Gemmataceae bacterium]|nr:metal ABC transporter permease [Gemmataceae bacterium]
MVAQLNAWIHAIADFCRDTLGPGTFLSEYVNVRGLLAILLVALVCGAVGSLVVGNRMAFFSDALAHCAFAGVALGLLMGFFTGAETDHAYTLWITLIMVAFGIVVGIAIAFMREYTGQANDTIIGVFFAGSIGLGAIFFKVGAGRRYMSPENFLFGNLVTMADAELLVLLALCAVTAAFLFWQYNDVTLASFSHSLAMSRRVRVRLCNYLFIIFLALIVNLCLKVVGALLINALLIVPAATAALVSRNMRQLFWASIGVCLLAGVGGHWLSWELSIPVIGTNSWTNPGEGGTIVLLSVLLFFLGLPVRSWQRRRDRRRAAAALQALQAAPASATHPVPARDALA